MSQEATSSLGGCRILDPTEEKGHLCTKLLGDMGTDVIRVEPAGGEQWRNRYWKA
ncbi:CoA transferase [Thermodesulfobacteriota bacterium]